MAGFRMRVLQALQQYHEVTPAGLCTVTEDTVEEVWYHSAKAWSRTVPGGKQSRGLYDLALIQLQQHQRLALEQGQVHTQRRVRQCVQTALSRGAQTKGAVCKQVAQAGRSPVAKGGCGGRPVCRATVDERAGEEERIQICGSGAAGSDRGPWTAWWQEEGTGCAGYTWI